MKKILIILMAVILCNCSDKSKTSQNRASSYVEDLPEYSAVVNDASHVMYVYAGTVDKHVKIPTLLGVLNDTADKIRTEYNDSLTAVRASIGGAAGWLKSGNKLYAGDTDDSVSVGAEVPLRKFWVNGGDMGTSNNIHGDTVYLYGDGTGLAWLTGIGDNLKLGDNNNASGVTLSSLVTGGTMWGLGSLSGTYFYYTLHPTYNFNFGAIAPTNYKVNVTGDLGVSGDIYTDNVTIKEYGTTGLQFNIPNSQYAWLISAPLTTGYASSLAVGVIRLMSQDYYPSPVLDGTVFFNDSTNKFLGYTGSKWDTLNSGGGTLTDHITDTLFFDYLAGDADVVLGLSVTGGVDTLHTVPAGFMLRDDLKIPSIFDYMKDVKEVNGEKELVWTYKDSNGEIKNQYGLDSLNPVEYWNGLQAGIERTDLMLLEQAKRINDLEKQIKELKVVNPSANLILVVCVVFVFLLLFILFKSK
jgi:hypothetical protein